MNAPTFKTLREALHLSRADLSQLWDLNERTIRSWEQGREPIPEARAKQLERWNNTVEHIAELTESAYLDMVEAGQIPDLVVLIRFKSQEDYERYVEDDNRLDSYIFNNALIGRVRNRLSQLKMRCGIVEFNAQSYEEHLCGYSNNQSLRAEWAAKFFKETVLR